MPHDPTTAVVMALLIALSVVGSTLGIRRLRSKQDRRGGGVEKAVAIAAGMLAVGYLSYRMASVHGTWAPLRSHADGVLLMITVIAGVTAYTKAVARHRGLELFALPTMAVLAGWGLCASWWTFAQSQFSVHSVWGSIHIILVYLGFTAAAITAINGGLYLFVQRQLKRRDDPAGRIRLLGRTASLEAIDRWLIGWATVAFILLTIIGIAGAIDAQENRTALGVQWWASGKVIGSIVAWLVFAVLAHVRFAPQLRGRRAAMLALAGFAIVLIITAKSLMSTGPTGGPDPAGSDTTHQTPQD